MKLRDDIEVQSLLLNTCNVMIFCDHVDCHLILGV